MSRENMAKIKRKCRRSSSMSMRFDHNNTKNNETYFDIGQKNESDDEDTHDGETNISPQFKSNDLVCLPSCINLDKGEGILKTRCSNKMVNHVLGWHVFLGTIKWEVFNVKLGSLKGKKGLLVSSLLYTYQDGWCWVVAKYFSIKLKMYLKF